MIKLTLSHMRWNWRTSLAILMCMALSSALLTGFTGYTEVVAVQELNQTLDQSSPAERSLLITGPRQTFNEELHTLLYHTVGDIIEDRLVIRQAWSPAEQPSAGELGERDPIDLLAIYSFDKLSENVRLVEGRLPDQVRLREATEYWRPPPIEAVLGARAAEDTGYRVGDRVIGSDGYHRLDIVGIVEPVDPHADIWGEDLSAFTINTVSPDSSTNLLALSLIIAPASMRSSYPEQPVFFHQVSWRVTFHRQLVDATRSETLLPDLINLRTQAATTSATIATDLINILASYLARLSRVRMTFYLLTAQTLLFVLYTLMVFSSFAIERSRVELTTLSARGTSPAQLARIFALENTLLALPAGFILGPGLAYGAIRFWGSISGEVVLRTLPGEAWALSAIAIGLGWLVLVLPIFVAARRDTLTSKPGQSRLPQRSAVQTHYIDLYLLCVGALLYWQLGRSGSFVMNRLRDTQFADPLLLLGPSLLLVAIAMVSLRLLPLLLQPITRALGRMRGVVIPLSAFRLSRELAQTERVVLLIGLTVGLLLFTSIFGDSLAHSQQEMSHYSTGADMRISMDQPTDLALEEASSLPGVEAWSPALRGTVETDNGLSIALLAVDPDTLAQVARFPAALGETTIPDLMHILKPELPGSETEPEEILGIFSPALPPRIGQGDRLLLHIGDTHLDVVVESTTVDFPTLSDPFVVVSLPDLEERLGLERLDDLVAQEAWLQVDPEQYDNLVAHPVIRERVLEDSREWLRESQSDALAMGISRALRVNGLTLGLFSMTTFCLIHLVGTQQREREFRTLQVMGLESRQMVGLVVTEGMLALFLGLLAGIGIGLGLSHIMIPFLSQPLAESLAGTSIELIVIDWPAIALLCAMLSSIYGLGLALTMIAVSQSRMSLMPKSEE